MTMTKTTGQWFLVFGMGAAAVQAIIDADCENAEDFERVREVAGTDATPGAAESYLLEPARRYLAASSEQDAWLVVVRADEHIDEDGDRIPGVDESDLDADPAVRAYCTLR